MTLIPTKKHLNTQIKAISFNQVKDTHEQQSSSKNPKKRNPRQEVEGKEGKGGERVKQEV